jgi:hypothetical protein
MAVRAMLLNDKHIYAAGPAEDKETLFDTMETDTWLAVFSKADGSRISKTELPAQPVFDGMAAANDSIYISLINGEIACYK